MSSGPAALASPTVGSHARDRRLLRWRVVQQKLLWLNPNAYSRGGVSPVARAAASLSCLDRNGGSHIGNRTVHGAQPRTIAGDPAGFGPVDADVQDRVRRVGVLVEPGSGGSLFEDRRLGRHLARKRHVR